MIANDYWILYYNGMLNTQKQVCDEVSKAIKIDFEVMNLKQV